MGTTHLTIDSRYPMWLDSTHPDRLHSRDQDLHDSTIEDLELKMSVANQVCRKSRTLKDEEFNAVIRKSRPSTSVCHTVQERLLRDVARLNCQ